MVRGCCGCNTPTNLRCFLSLFLMFWLGKTPVKPLDIVWYHSVVILMTAHCKSCILCPQFFKCSLSELSHIAGSRSDFIGDLVSILVFNKKYYDLILLWCECFHTFAEQLVLKPVFDALDKFVLDSPLKRMYAIEFLFLKIPVRYALTGTLPFCPHSIFGLN